MKKDDIKEGQRYLLRHATGEFVVEVREIKKQQTYGANSRTITRYHCFKFKTKREVIVKSAAKFVKPYTGELYT